LWYAPQAKQFVRNQYVFSGGSFYWSASNIDNELISFDVW
jgi:hypothetical protein